MLQNFVSDSITPLVTLPSTPALHPSTNNPHRDPVRILVIGTPTGINAICHSLHIKGFARLDEWSPLLPHDAGRYCRILTRYILQA